MRMGMKIKMKANTNTNRKRQMLEHLRQIAVGPPGGQRAG